MKSYCTIIKQSEAIIIDIPLCDFPAFPTLIFLLLLLSLAMEETNLFPQALGPHRCIEMEDSLSLELDVSAGKIMERYTAFQLRGIPVACEESSVRKLLQRALDLEDEIAVQVRSLADSPYDESEAVATLTFSEIPPKLSTPLKPPKAKGILPKRVS